MNGPSLSNSTQPYNENQPDQLRQGWTGGPNNRGSLDIIWSCVLTMFLCCWSVLVVNVPDPGTSPWKQVVRKLHLVALCALAPEIIFQAALGQWISARRSMILFHSSGYDDWTMRHSFYADMGAIHLTTPDFKRFPIDAQQLHYLISKGYVEYPQIPEDHIQDKNKVDGMLRLITLLQTVWFVLNVLGRVSQRLAITALELSTTAFVMLSIATTLCWIKKPADVQYPDYVTTETTIADILRDGGDQAAGVYYYTPLDFVNRKEWAWSILWSHGLGYLRKMRLASQPSERPITRFQNTKVPVIEGFSFALFISVTLGYFAISIAGWNFDFPTQTEQVLWRAASLTGIVVVFGFFVNQGMHWKWYPALRRKFRSAVADELIDEHEPYSEVSVCAKQLAKTRDSMLHTLSSFLRNNSVLKDPALDAPVSAIIITWILGIFYCAARAYLLIADFLELRSLPLSAYEEVNWTAALPHYH